jgi:hypothetical protein
MTNNEDFFGSYHKRVYFLNLSKIRICVQKLQIVHPDILHVHNCKLYSSNICARMICYSLRIMCDLVVLMLCSGCLKNVILNYP